MTRVWPLLTISTVYFATECAVLVNEALNGTNPAMRMIFMCNKMVFSSLFNRLKTEHMRLPEAAILKKRKVIRLKIHLLIRKYKNAENTFHFYLPRENHPAVYFELIVFFKRLEIARL